jgi:hypothetical protein
MYEILAKPVITVQRLGTGYIHKDYANFLLAHCLLIN